MLTNGSNVPQHAPFSETKLQVTAIGILLEDALVCQALVYLLSYLEASMRCHGISPSYFHTNYIDSKPLFASANIINA